MDNLISRQIVIDMIKRATWDNHVAKDAKGVINAICNIPSVLPDCEGCKHLDKWENEVEYGYNSPCTACKRRVADHYER